MSWLAGIDPQVLLICFTLGGALLALPFAGLGFLRIWQMRPVAGALHLLLGAFLITLGVAAALLAASLHTYQRLTSEQAVAKASLRKLGERHFGLTLEPQGGVARYYEVRGDEWQIDARVLKWKPMGTLLGLDTIYRFERLSGRYGDIALERRGPRTVHALSEDTGLDFWTVVRQYHDWLPLADALYGSAAYVPLAESAEYTVAVSNPGLLVRPANDAAKKALGGWK